MNSYPIYQAICQRLIVVVNSLRRFDHAGPIRPFGRDKTLMQRGVGHVPGLGSVLDVIVPHVRESFAQ